MTFSFLVTRNGDQLIDANGNALVIAIGPDGVPRIFPLSFRPHSRF